MEEKNKKALVPTIIAVVTLVLLTIGATYAYFRVATDNNFGTPKIEATTPSIGSVALSTGSNLTMNLTAEEMMEKDADVTYYASPSGTTTDTYTENIGTATVTGEGSYTCTYTLTIDDNSNSLYDKFQNGYANKSAGQVVLTVNGVEYDFNKAGLFPKEISGTMSGLTSSAPQYITAQLKLVNSKSINQSNLAGQNITLTFGVEDFSCTAESEDDSLALCIRATELHQANVAVDCDGICEGDSLIYEDITYGNLGTKGEDLVSGDALTCDVNGDGDYDEETERFYYVSDYYNTTTKEFEDDKATLIYYKNTGSETAYYAAADEKWHGPVTAMTQLPKTNEWSNVRLINSQRAILNELDGNTVVDGGVTYNLPTAFDYSEYSARLLTYQEALSGCSNAEVDLGYAEYSYKACNYLAEGTNYTGEENDYWLETPLYDSVEIIDGVYYVGFGTIGFSARVNSPMYFARPAIEVFKTDIDY